jgi:chromosome segregation protein
MQDVLFSGAGGRKASAVAEVSLMFDDGSGSLPLDCAELEVTRRLTRDSGSQYRLNGNECRLLDVQDLVGALGLGREMHSVISQGKVEAMLNSSPEARRAMVEEAAGLGRFKKRRERAQAKLERTGQNLLRVADIEGEVKTALRPLKQQVVAAERFAEVTEEWALAVARSLAHALAEVLDATARTEHELKITEAALAAVGTKTAELRRERTSEEQSFNQTIQERERLSGAYHRARAGAEYLEGRAVALRQRLARVEGEIDRARRRRDMARSEVAALTGRSAEVTAVTADELRLERVGSWGEMLRGALEEALPAFRADTAAEDDLKDSVFELEAARSRAVQDREFLRRDMAERARVGEGLRGLLEEARVRAQQLQADADRLDVEVAEGEDAVRAAGSALGGAAAARDEARARLDEARSEQTAVLGRISGLASRRTVLEDLLTRRAGMPAGLRDLVASYPGCRLLTDVLTVKPGFERALAAALGPLIHAAVVPHGDDLLRVLGVSGVLEAIQEVADQPRPKAEDGLPAGACDLWDLVTGPERAIAALRRLVPATAVFLDAEEFGDRFKGVGARGLGDSWRLVSRSGELFQSGLHAARRQELGAESLFAARSELEAVTRESEELAAGREAMGMVVERAAAETAKADGLFREQEEQLHQWGRRVAVLRSECDLQRRRMEEVTGQSAELQGREERESETAEKLVADISALEDTMAGREAELEEARAGLRALQSRLETGRRTVGRLEEKKGQAALVEVKLRERCRAHNNERVRVQGLRQTADREVARYERRLMFFERYVPVITSLLAVTERLADKSRGLADRLEADVESIRARSEGTARVMRDWGSAEAGLQREYETMSARLTQGRVDEARLQERRTQLDEEVAELRRRHLSPRGVKPEDVAGADAVALAAAVERAARRRERIGPVNPLAEQECAEMEDRARFLAEQRGDLEAAVGQLREVIAGLDEHIERSFGEIFTATREHFSAVIAAVFPGAKGDLRLTEPKPAARAAAAGEGGALDEGEDEQAQQAPGIALEVKFANKSPRSLTLLSGGEKAMTAIAFLFSLFLARPCPFYILDEVEASLDDINIRRFLSLVHKYRERTQFIIITHQRQTMEVADTLYGVTMESDGTSRVLSRRLTTAKGA